MRGDPKQAVKADPREKALLVPLAREGAASLFLHANNPGANDGVCPELLMKHQRAHQTAIRYFFERYISNKNRWCVAALAKAEWALKIFPDLPADQAVARLWELIFESARIGSDGDAWQSHSAALKSRCQRLNSLGLTGLLLRSSNGTKLYVGLPEGHSWEGGGDKDTSGVPFFPNIPTEEVFTAPHRERVNGTVRSSMPLIHRGVMINDFTLTFRRGKAVSVKAAQGEELLKKIIETDAGASRLGEIALVPHSSPISRSGVLFYDSLFDENASCHLALGEAFAKCLDGAQGKPAAVQKRLGLNKSLTHVDFMIGTPDMDIVGIKKNGDKVWIFKQGDWAF